MAEANEGETSFESVASDESCNLSVRNAAVARTPYDCHKAFVQPGGSDFEVLGLYMNCVIFARRF